MEEAKAIVEEYKGPKVQETDQKTTSEAESHAEALAKADKSLQMFALYWINKTTSLSEYSPEQLQSKIKTQTEYIKANMNRPDISQAYQAYLNIEQETEEEASSFWADMYTHQPVIPSCENKMARMFFQSNPPKILIFAGAGMSQDSGLPTFRKGNKTLLTADYANHKQLIKLCDSKTPHQGYHDLLEFCKGKEYFVMTTNIDGFFVRAGFDQRRVIETHGSLYRVQCDSKCTNKVYEYTVNMCPDCGGQTRPNVLLFGDRKFVNSTDHIDQEMSRWIDEGDEQILIIEIGAGIYIPTIRQYSEILVNKYKDTKKVKLIRVNPEYWGVPSELLHTDLTAKLQLTGKEFVNMFLNE